MTSWLNSECFKVTKKATNYLLYKPGQICGQYSLLNNWKKRHLHVRTQPNTRAAGLIADSSASDSSQACLLLGIYQGSFEWMWYGCGSGYDVVVPTGERNGFAVLLPQKQEWVLLCFWVCCRKRKTAREREKPAFCGLSAENSPRQDKLH